jgi:hypothetical protein
MSEELSNAFCVPADELWFRAVLAKLDDHISDAQLFVTLPASAQNHGTLASAAGRLDSLITLREDLVATRTEKFSNTQKQT